jgi:AAA family ATP:ADP antiporter
VIFFERVLSRVGIEPSERALCGWAGLCLALLGAAAYALFNASEALFLKRVGVAYLPWVLLASSFALVVTTGLAGRGLATADRPRAMPGVLIGLAALLVAFWVLLSLWQVPAVFGVFVLVSRQLLALGLLVTWLALGDLLTGRRAKRLFAPLAAGITIGGIVGSFGSDPVARLVGIEGLVLVSAALLLGAALAARRLPGAAPGGPVGAIASGGAARDAGIRSEEVSPQKVWRESPLFRLLLVSVLCGGLLSPVLYFEFSYLADAATAGADGEQRLLALFAQFRGWLNIGTLAFQLWLSGQLYRRIGLPLSLALEPVSYLLGFAWLGVRPGLMVGVAALGAGRITEDGIAGPGMRVLFNLFPERLRARASGLLQGPINRVGGVVGNGAVLLALAAGATSLIAWAALPVAILWTAAALKLWRSYPKLLLQASGERSLASAGADMATLLDARTIRALAKSLRDPDPRVCRAAVDLVRAAEPASGVEVLAEALVGAPASTRPLLVDALHALVEPLPAGSLRDGSAPAALAEVLEEVRDKEVEERADLLQSYARLVGSAGAEDRAGQSSLRVLNRALGDREAAVRLVAVAELHRRGCPPPGVADLAAVLRSAITGRDVLIRRSARRELRAMLVSRQPDDEWHAGLTLLAECLGQRADRAETAEALVEVARRHGGGVAPIADRVVRWMDDRDPRVRAAVLRFAGHAGLTPQMQRLIAGLGSHFVEVSAAAREGLVAFGSAATEPLLADVEAGASARRKAVVSVLRELDPERALLEAFYTRQLERARAAAVLRVALDGRDPSRLVLRRLEERVTDGAGTLLALLSVLQDDERIGELEWRLRHASDERARDIVVEALEALLAPAARAGLMPLIEDAPWEQGVRTGSAFGRRTPSAAEAWDELLQDPDPVSWRLARRFAPQALEERRRMGDAPGVLDPMDVAVRLQDAPAFGRLPTRQLMGLAEVLEEMRFDAGATVFSEGDEADGIYFVYEGEVEIRHGGSITGSIGPGAFFGELSTLDGVPRNRSARACEASLLLRLEREELLALMEQDPALGIGLSQFLCSRVRALQDGAGSG